jgi:hypothetical protein
MHTNAFLLGLTIFVIIYYLVAIFAIVDMFKWHKIEKKWLWLWIPIGIIIILGTDSLFHFSQELSNCKTKLKCNKFKAVASVAAFFFIFCVF